VHAKRDTYSPLEAGAIAYAYAKGAVLVAAVGNADDAFAEPWPFASYPAALPHVVGVGALSRAGDVPDFSNRDPIYNDLSAPGQGIFSTLPLALTALRPTCQLQGFSDCGPDDYRNAEGTSFAAPQVSAAAAVLFALDPALRNSQAAMLLEHSADDVGPATGCPRCTAARDALSGWGRLDVARAVQALSGALPTADRYETNDDAGRHAHTILGKQRVLAATADYYDDPVDVYRVALGRGQRLELKLGASWTGARVRLELWKPGTRRVDEARERKSRVAASAAPRARQRLSFTAPARGWYYVEVKVDSPGYGPYALTLAKR
jgi:hypothetical protein